MGGHAVKVSLMNIKIFTDPDDKLLEQWAKFVIEHPNGNIFQTPQYYSILKSQQNTKPISLFLIDDDEILSILIGEQLSENKIYKHFTKRAVLRGGPLIQNRSPKILQSLFEAYIKKYSGDLIYSEFRMVGKASIISNSDFPGLIPEERLNIVIDLTKSENELYAALHPTRRRQIQRGYRRDLKTEIIDSSEHKIIESCYLILSTLYNKIKLPFPSLSFFISAAEHFRQYLKIFIVKYGNELVGFRFVLCYKDLIYDWYAACKEEHYDKYPNDILPWEVIKWGSKNGYKYFDFGGAGKPSENYGVRDYKLKFGGKLVTTMRYKMIHKPFEYSIGHLGLKFVRSFK